MLVKGAKDLLNIIDSNFVVIAPADVLAADSAKPSTATFTHCTKLDMLSLKFV